MSECGPGSLSELSTALSAELDVSNRHLAAAAWLRREHLPHTARLLFAMSDAHATLTHRIAHLFARRGYPTHLGALNPPRHAFVSVLDAVREATARRTVVLEAIATAATKISHDDPGLAIDLAKVFLHQRRLSRRAAVLEDAAARHGSDAARLERWARRNHRGLTLLPESLAPLSLPVRPTPPTHAVTARSVR